MFRFSSLLTVGACAAACGLSTHRALGASVTADDTIQVRLSSGAAMTLHVRDAGAIKRMRASQMDSLLATLDRYVKQAEAVAQIAGDAGRTALEFYPARDLKNPAAPEKLRVVVYNDPKRGATTTTSTASGTMPVIVSGEVTDVSVGGRSGVRVRVEEGNGHDRTIVHIGASSQDNDEDERNEDSIRHARHQRFDQERTHGGLNLGFGLNTLMHSGRAALAGTTPSTSVPVDLRTWGSRYVQLGWLWDTRLGEQVNASPFVRYGFSFAFSNYMLGKNRQWVDENDVTKLQNSTEDRELTKSKLATTVLNLPVIFGVKLRNTAGKEVLRLAAGGYGGYRLGAHTKLKYQEDGKTRKVKDPGSYNLEDWQYGLTGALGIYGTELFVNYNLNEVFKKDRGPSGNVLSFGVTLIGLDGDLRAGHQH